MWRGGANQFGNGARCPKLPAPFLVGLDILVILIPLVEVQVIVHLRHDDEEGGEGDSQPDDVEDACREETPEGMREVAC